MAGSTWDNMTPLERQHLEQYQNIKAFLKEMPYRPNDQAGQKLSDALTREVNILGKEITVGINTDFATRLNRALADSSVRQGIAGLPADKLAANVDRVIAGPEKLPQILAEVRAASPQQVAQATTASAQPTSPATPSAREPVAAATTAPATPAQTPPQAKAPTTVKAPLSSTPGAVAATPETGTNFKQALLEIAAAAPDQATKQALTAIANASGIEELGQRISSNPDLRDAILANLSRDLGESASGKSFAQRLQEKLQQDPDYINKVNNMLDRAPPQMLSSMARDISSDPKADLFAMLDRGVQMSNNPLAQMLQSLGNSPFGNILKTVCESIMSIVGPLLRGLGMGQLADTMQNALQGFSKGQRQIATSDPQGRTPLADRLDLANGVRPQTAVSGPDGKPVAPTPTPGQAPAQVAGQPAVRQTSDPAVRPDGPTAPI